MLRTKLKISTMFSASTCFSMASIVMNVPVRPTPALEKRKREESIERKGQEVRSEKEMRGGEKMRRKEGGGRREEGGKREEGGGGNEKLATSQNNKKHNTGAQTMSSLPEMISVLYMTHEGQELWMDTML